MSGSLIEGRASRTFHVDVSSGCNRLALRQQSPLPILPGGKLLGQNRSMKWRLDLDFCHEDQHSYQSRAQVKQLIDTMGCLLDLPDECICLILEFLRPSQIRRLALIFNKRLVEIAQPYLEPLNKLHQDETYFKSLFGEIQPELGDMGAMQMDAEIYVTPSLSIPDRPSHHLEFLDLKGDLDWLKEIPRED